MRVPSSERPEDDMELDIHVPRFTWPGGPEAIGPDVCDLGPDRGGNWGADPFGHGPLVPDGMLWPAEEPMLEGYTALSFAAAKTERLRFRLLVGGVTYRHPGLLAKTITTLDVLSGGRAELGLGAAWYEREHRGLGVPFPPLRERYERLEETLQICFQMWSDDDGPYAGSALPTGRDALLTAAGELAQAAGAHRRRGRAQDPATRRDLRRCLQHHRDAETVAHKVEVLRRHCDEVGRDFGEIEVTALIGVADDAGPDAIVDEAEALHAAGVDAIVARRPVQRRRSGSRRRGGRSCRGWPPSPDHAPRSAGRIAPFQLPGAIPRRGRPVVCRPSRVSRPTVSSCPGGPRGRLSVGRRRPAGRARWSTAIRDHCDERFSARVLGSLGPPALANEAFP